jgi:hypothetical protein
MKDTLLKRKEDLERQRDALLASQVMADLNAILGGLQTIEFLLDEEESKE